MKSKLLVLFSLVLCTFIVACTEVQEDAPSLSEEQLIRLISDAHLVEGALQNVGVEALDSMTQLYYQQVFEMNGVTEEEFKKNLDYLKSHPDYAEKIYEQVIEEFSNLKLE